MDKRYWDEVRKYEELEQVSLRAKEARERKERVLREEQQARLAEQLTKEHAAKLAAAQAAEREAARRKRRTVAFAVGFVLLSLASSTALAQFVDVGQTRFLWYLLVPASWYITYHVNDPPFRDDLAHAMTVMIVVSLVAPLIVFLGPLTVFLQTRGITLGVPHGYGGKMVAIAVLVAILGVLYSRYLFTALAAFVLILLAAASG